MKNGRIPIYLCIWLTYISCKDNQNCKDVMCTELFASVSVKIENPGGSLKGITTRSLLNSSGKVIHMNLVSDTIFENTFTVVDDSQLNTLGHNSVQEVEFWVIRNDSVLTKKKYTIKTDCCHVSKLAGDEVVIIP